MFEVARNPDATSRLPYLVRLPLPGGDLVLIGSIDTARALIDAGLVDEYYLTLNPVILGGGRRLLDDIHGSIDLRLADSETFSTGVVACHYVKA